MRQITTVKTVIDGIEYTFRGQLSKNGKILKCKKGMILTIDYSKDIVTHEMVLIRKREQIQPIYLDISKWFKMTKQIN